MAIIFQDLFNDTPGTLLINHTPDVGTGWLNEIISFRITGTPGLEINTTGIEAAPVSNSTDARQLVVTDPVFTTSDYQIEANIPRVSADVDASVWIAGRYESPSTFYLAGGYPANGGPQGVEKAGVMILRIRGNVVEVLGHNPDIGITGGTNVRFVVTDQAKELWLNGNLILRSVDNSIAGPGRAGIGHGNFFSSFDDIRTVVTFADFTVDDVIATEPVKTEIPIIRVSTGSDSQIQLFKWEGLNETNRGEPFVDPRLTRKTFQVVGDFQGGVVRLEAVVLPPAGPESFPGQFVEVENSLGLPVRLMQNGVIDRINHAFAYRPVVVSGSGADVDAFLLSVAD